MDESWPQNFKASMPWCDSCRRFATVPEVKERLK
jgi:hypothetical protein